MHSLMRGQICNFQCTQSLIGLITILDCLSWNSGPHIYIPQEQGGPVIPPGTGLAFCHLLRLKGYREGILSCLHMVSQKVESVILWLTVSQSILVSGHHIGPETNFSFTSMEIIFRHSGFVMGPPLWQEDGSVIYSCCWASPAVFLRSESRGAHDHILLSQFGSPPAWRARFSYIFTPGTGWLSYTSGHCISLMLPLMIHKAIVKVFWPTSTQCLEVKVEAKLWPVVRQPVCLGVESSFVVHDQIFMAVGHLWSSCCAAPSLMKRVCHLPVQFVGTFGFKSHRTRELNLLSHLWLT
jgi:hypothetical protein